MIARCPCGSISRLKLSITPIVTTIATGAMFYGLALLLSPFPGGSVNYAGSVRMHADPGFGALDAWNRLHDVPNVAVVDMACVTTNPEKNPTLTAMALAARAVNRLADDLAPGARY